MHQPQPRVHPPHFKRSRDYPPNAAATVNSISSISFKVGNDNHCFLLLPCNACTTDTCISLNPLIFPFNPLSPDPFLFNQYSIASRMQPPKPARLETPPSFPDKHLQVGALLNHSPPFFISSHQHTLHGSKTQDRLPARLAFHGCCMVGSTLHPDSIPMLILSGPMYLPRTRKPS